MFAAKLQLVVRLHHNMKLHCEDVCRMDIWAFFGGGGDDGRGGSGHKGDLDKKELRAQALCFVTSLQQHNDNVNEELVRNRRR